MKLVDIDGSVVHETEKAYLFDDGRIKVWLPKSRCEWDQADKRMTMDRDLAYEKGLI